MNREDFERFSENIEWFNQFFADVQLIFAKTAKRLTNRFGLGDPGYYYPKPRDIPDIPEYYMMAVGGDFCVQMFAIFKGGLLEDQKGFAEEPSMLIVAHSRGDKALWPEEYGLRVARNSRVSIMSNADGVIQGEITYDPPVRFLAFQIPMERFTTKEEISTVIDEVIVENVERFVRAIEE